MINAFLTLDVSINYLDGQKDEQTDRWIDKKGDWKTDRLTET